MTDTAACNDVVCVRCSTAYPNVLPGMEAAQDQGYGCAAGRQDDGEVSIVMGHYGSLAYDMTVLTVVDKTRVLHGNLCDACIDVLVASGALRERTQEEYLASLPEDDEDDEDDEHNNGWGVVFDPDVWDDLGRLDDQDAP